MLCKANAHLCFDHQTTMVVAKATELFLRRTISSSRPGIRIGISSQTRIATGKMIRIARSLHKTNFEISSPPRRTYSNDLTLNHNEGVGEALVENENLDNGYKHLLTRATARQLRGDVTEAIALSNNALENLKLLQKNQTNESHSPQVLLVEEIADTLLFLGKLHQLQGSFADAIDLFAESRAIYKQQQDKSGESPTENTSKFETVKKKRRRKELVALSHLATARGKLRHLENASESTADTFRDQDICSIEADFKEALEGLENDWGWSDGMTNHTAHEWSLYCSRTMNDPEKALSILSTMKENLCNVFGSDDRRVLQLNGEMAELWQRISTADGETTDQNKSADNSSITNIDGPPQSIMPQSAGENAISLLEEALDKLPPNSPEALRVFMQLEELKERQELQEQPSRGRSDGIEGIATTMASTGVTGTVTVTRSAADTDITKSHR